MKKILKKLNTPLKITFLTGLLFVFLFRQFTLKGILITFFISAMYTFILGFGQSVINNYLSSKFDWVKQTNKRLWLGVICTITYTIPAVLLINYIIFVEIQGINMDLFFKKQYFWIHCFYILISFLISSLLHSRGFMLELKRVSKKETHQQQIIAKSESAKFESLKNQIDPHFLFNSLNVLTSLISENPIQAEKFTTKLSKIYRYVLEQRNKSLVPVYEELNFAKIYIDLLQMRFENAIQFNISDTMVDLELNIVPLSLQLLLENAVKHNVASVSNPLQLKIYQENNYLVVENNNNPKQILEQKSTRVGLQNISDRYELLSNISMKINKSKTVFKVKLPLLNNRN